LPPSHASRGPCVSLAAKLALFDDYWNPRIVGELNGQYVKVAKVKGEFDWHAHENEDELFLVIKGELRIETPDDDLRIGPGELAIIPRGQSHRPSSVGETHILLFEPKTTVNTGEVRNERTVACDWI
jgi:mannose-6-phosphate isomerase-like protein (cupin superfamily)